MGAFGWDDAVDVEEREFKVFEPGVYEFTVTSFERGQYNGGQKIPPCNMATFTLEVQGFGIRYRLYLVDEQAWKLSQFFKGVGLVAEDASTKGMRFPWERAVGCKGRVELKKRSYVKDGQEREVNDVVRILRPSEDAVLGPKVAAPAATVGTGWQPTVTPTSQYGSM